MSTEDPQGTFTQEDHQVSEETALNFHRVLCLKF